jgi:zinc protease
MPSALCSLPSALFASLLLAQTLVTGQSPAAPFKGRAPVSTEVLRITLPRAQEVPLSNGAHLMVLEDHRVPTVQFEIIVIGAGGYYDPQGLPGLADTTASLMDEGTASKTSEQIAQALDTMAASVSVSANEGSQIATVTGSALTDQFDAVLALASDILLNPSFPEKEIALYKVRTRAGLEQALSRVVDALAERPMTARAVV